MAQDFDIEGGVKLDKVLKALPVKLEAKILRGAMGAGAKVIQKEARNRVPVRTGRLRKSIRTSTRKKGRSVFATIKAGGRKKKQAFYAHMVERGTTSHSIQASADRTNRRQAFVGALVIGGRVVRVRVQHPGSRAQSFMRPALRKAPVAVKAISDYIRVRLSKLK